MIPVNDLKRSFLQFQSEFENKAVEVLRSGWYVLGKEVAAFEQGFAETMGAKHCVGVDNGLNAILLGIRALGISAGDEVIVQSNTYIATVLGVSLNGATPVFVEPDEYMNIDPAKIEAAITARTKAVLVTHLYGQASSMGRIAEICKRRGLYLLEDCAQSHMAEFGGKKTGTFGAMGFFSFYPTKNLGGFGDGGAVLTDIPELDAKLRVLRNYGSVRRYVNDVEGHNSRLDEIQAGLLNVKLAHINEITAERVAVARRYLCEIKNSLVELPKTLVGATHVYHLFVVKVDNQAAFIRFLKGNGVGCDVHYPTPPHLSGAYARLGHKAGDFPIAENLSKRVVSIPVFNGIEEWEVSKVIETVNAYEGV